MREGEQLYSARSTCTAACTEWSPVWHQSTARAIRMHWICELSYRSRGNVIQWSFCACSAASSRTRLSTSCDCFWNSQVVKSCRISCRPYDFQINSLVPCAWTYDLPTIRIRTVYAHLKTPRFSPGHDLSHTCVSSQSITSVCTLHTANIMDFCSGERCHSQHNLYTISNSNNLVLPNSFPDLLLFTM